mgnify:CR=1 FL=1
MVKDKNTKLMEDIMGAVRTVHGICPECGEETMLVSVVTDYYRCTMCGEDTKQYINGSINITHGLETNGMFLVEKDGDGVIYAKTYEVAFTMSALHEGTPGFDENGNFLDGDMFPYQTETSSANFFQNQSEGASDPNTTGQKPARLPGQNPSSTAQELNKQAKNVLS